MRRRPRVQLPGAGGENTKSPKPDTCLFRWHAGHVLYASVCLAAGFYAREGLDVEIVDTKVNPQGVRSNRRGGERYDEIDPRANAGVVFQDQTSDPQHEDLKTQNYSLVPSILTH